MSTEKEGDRTQPPDKKSTETPRSSSDLPGQGTITSGQAECVENKRLSETSLQLKHGTDTTEVLHREEIENRPKEETGQPEIHTLKHTQDTKKTVAFSRDALKHGHNERETENKQFPNDIESESRSKEGSVTPAQQQTQDTKVESALGVTSQRNNVKTNQKHTREQFHKSTAVHSEYSTTHGHNESKSRKGQLTRDMQSENRSKEWTGKFETSTLQHTHERKAAVSEDVTLQRHNETKAKAQQHSHHMMFVKNKCSDTEEPYQIKPNQRNIENHTKNDIKFNPVNEDGVKVCAYKITRELCREQDETNIIDGQNV